MLRLLTGEELPPPRQKWLCISVLSHGGRVDRAGAPVVPKQFGQIAAVAPPDSLHALVDTYYVLRHPNHKGLTLGKGTSVKSTRTLLQAHPSLITQKTRQGPSHSNPANIRPGWGGADTTSYPEWLLSLNGRGWPLSFGQVAPEI